MKASGSIKAFMDEELDLAEERFSVIDRSFVLLIEDWDKIMTHFKNKEENKETIENLNHLAKLIPSLLVELGRGHDAIKLIQEGRNQALKSEF